jgi:hypothetical protein
MGATAADLFQERRKGRDHALQFRAPRAIPLGIPDGTVFVRSDTSDPVTSNLALGGHLVDYGGSGGGHGPVERMSADRARPATLETLIASTIEYGV